MRNFLVVFIFLVSTSAHASLEMCLKLMNNMKLSRSMTAGNISSGVENSYIVNDGMIVSAYADPRGGGKRVVVIHTPKGTVNVDTEKRSCSTEAATTADEISAIINYNLTDYGTFGPQSLHKPAITDVKELIAQCKSAGNEKITAAMDSIEAAMGLPRIAAPAAGSTLR